MEESLTVTKKNKKLKQTQKKSHNIEFFHIYTDETIGEEHTASLNYLKAAQTIWSMDYSLTVLIDNYNPTKHILTSEAVMDYLSGKGLSPDYWAFEADMVENAKTLLEAVTRNKLKKQYSNYIQKQNKFPCSLLTASWYLTRLGELDTSIIKTVAKSQEYIPAERLINILPAVYKPFELRAFELIRNSDFSASEHKIQDLFYPAGSHRKIDLF